MNISIKQAEKNRVVGCGTGGKKLSAYTEAELVTLGIAAHKSNSKLLLGLFDTLPTLDVLTGEKTDAEISRIAAPVKAKAKTAKSVETPTVEYQAPAPTKAEEPAVEPTTEPTTTEETKA